MARSFFKKRMMPLVVKSGMHLSCELGSFVPEVRHFWVHISVSWSLLWAEWIIWSPCLSFWPEIQLTLSPSAVLTFTNEIIFSYDPSEPDRSRTMSETLLTGTENDAMKTVHAVVFSACQ